MRLTVLGACGAWPEAGQACSGYLVEQDGFRLLVDLGYATVPRLLKRVTADQVDAVFISHGHPDHCADLSPLLRARALRDDPPAPLPVYALPGAVDAVLALDRPGMLAGAYVLREFSAGSRMDIGPFSAETCLLPHWVPNVGVRLAADDQVLVYTGDCGPSPVLAEPPICCWPRPAMWIRFPRTRGLTCPAHAASLSKRPMRAPGVCC